MKILFLSVAFTFLTLSFSGVFADEISQVTNPQGTITTTIESASGTTTINNSPGQSVVTRMSDGTKVEMDSDNSVYTVYPDGSRVAAPNGVHTLAGGQTITVKDGKRIP